MEVPEINEIKQWSPDGVRQVCRDHHLYTMGTGEEYDRMLGWIRYLKPEKENIWFVAKDIFDHSDVTESGTVTNVMFYLNREAVWTTYGIKGEM